LPLAARGIRVDGIDVSTAMVAQLRAKPGGDAIAVTMGDFADVPVPGTYRLIYVVFNTLFNLLTQDEQVHCFENVADHLTDDGSFSTPPARNSCPFTDAGLNRLVSQVTPPLTKPWIIQLGSLWLVIDGT